MEVLGMLWICLYPRGISSATGSIDIATSGIKVLVCWGVAGSIYSISRALTHHLLSYSNFASGLQCLRCSYGAFQHDLSNTLTLFLSYSVLKIIICLTW